MHRQPVLLLSSVLFLFSCLVWASCSSPDPVVWSTSGSYAGWSPDAKYVGIEACGTCHQSQHDSYIRSQMGRSFKHAVRSLSDADWDNIKPIFSESDNLYYQPFARGEQLFVKEYRLSGADTLFARTEQIDYIVGSGQHTNSHMYEINGYLYQIPVTWYAQDKKWGLAPKFQQEGNNYRFGRVITDECMACHNGPSDFVPGSENRFENLSLGITCEKCHGPGSIHIAEKEQGIIVNIATDIDFSIVNPGKLEPQQQLDVCKRCHMQGAAVFAEGEDPQDWRPGKLLSTHENVFWPRQPDSTTHFLMASHPDRLAMSSCFLESWKPSSGLKPITCLTCHDPHFPVEETGADVFSAVCQNCHTGSNASGEPTLTCTEPTVVNGTATVGCASCHMPESGSIDIPNIRITDHYIRVPDRLTPSESEAQVNFIRLAALIDPRPDLKTKAEGFLTYYEQFTDRPGMLDSAEVYLQRAETANLPGLIKSWIRLWHLQANHEAVRRTALDRESLPEDMWTLYRVGEAYAAINDYASAVRWYERALALGPDHLRFMDKLGVALTQAGRASEAIVVYNNLLSLNPLFENGLNNRGFARLIAEDLVGAEADFKAALSLSPDLELALANLSSLYLNTNRQEEAIPIMRRLITQYPNNPEYARVWQLIQGG